MKPISISEYWCTQNKKDFSAEIARHESQGWVIFQDLATQMGRVVIMYLPQDKDLENQAAFPKLVLKDFTAALLANPKFPVGASGWTLETAIAFTKQYKAMIDMTDIQLVEDALQKLRPIPEDQWIRNKYTDGKNRCCAMGHYTRLSGNNPNDYHNDNCSQSLAPDFMDKLGDRLRNLTIHTTGDTLVNANNGTHCSYSQDSCKLRTIACLEDTLFKIKQEKL